jgi:large subunit ribosomal protein L31
MKKDIHPAYMDSKIVCGCGTVTEIKATVKEMHVDICASCHPFYTGTQKLIDTAGRVEKFRRRAAKASK